MERTNTCLAGCQKFLTSAFALIVLHLFYTELYTMHMFSFPHDRPCLQIVPLGENVRKMFAFPLCAPLLRHHAMHTGGSRKRSSIGNPIWDCRARCFAEPSKQIHTYSLRRKRLFDSLTAVPTHASGPRRACPSSSSLS